MIRTLTLAAALALLVSHAQAHEWYPSTCCNGNRATGDCSPIPNSAISYTSEGLVVTLLPGMHRRVTSPHRWVFPLKDVRQSADDRWHACLWPTERTLRCLFQPDAGV